MAADTKTQLVSVDVSDPPVAHRKSDVADSPQIGALKANKANLQSRLKELASAPPGSEYDHEHQRELAQRHLDEVNKALGGK